MNYKIHLLFLFLMLNALPGKAQQTPDYYCAQINTYTFVHYPLTNRWSMPEVYLTENDSLTVSFPGMPGSKPKNIALRAIYCINQITYKQVGKILIYYKTSEDQTRKFGTFSSMTSGELDTIALYLDSLLLSVNLPIPSKTCPEYQYDNAEARLSIHYASTDPSIRVRFRYQIDSTTRAKQLKLTDKNGNLRCVRNLKKGELNGTQISYHENGIIADSGYYEMGYPVGKHISRFDNGNLAKETFYIDGIEHGVRLEYWGNGVVNTKSTLEMGVLKGEEYFYENGEPQY